MPWKKLSVTNQMDNEKIIQTLNQIDNVKKKINLKEKSHDVAAERNAATEKINEEMIHALKNEIQDLREDLSWYLKVEFNLFLELFSKRPKRALLALKNKTSLKEISYEVNQKVCECKSMRNRLIFMKNEKLKKIAELKRFIELKLKMKKQKPFTSCAPQLENACDLIKQKIAAAKKIRSVYIQVRKQLEDQVISYPKLIDDLEKEKQHMNEEDICMRYLNEVANREVEMVTRDKKIIQERSRQSKKHRDTGIKRLETIIAGNIEHGNEIHEAGKLGHTLKKKRQSKSVHEKEVAESAIKPEEEKFSYFQFIIKEYEDQANLLKFATGIPFWNINKMTLCLRSQMEKAKELKRDTKKKQKKLQSLQNRKHILMEQLNQIQYNSNTDLQEQIELTEDFIASREDLIAKWKRKLYKQHKIVDKVLLCSDVILTSLARSNVLYKIREDSEDSFNSFNEDEEEEKKHKHSIVALTERFEKITNSLVTLSDEENTKMDPKSYAEALMVDLSQARGEQDKAYQQANIRLTKLLDGSSSEYEFDQYYNTPNNDQYISREAVKRRTDISIRASRARR